VSSVAPRPVVDGVVAHDAMRRGRPEALDART